MSQLRTLLDPRTPSGAALRARLAHFGSRMGLGLGTALALSGPAVGCSGGDGERLYLGAESASNEAASDEVTPYAHVDVSITQRVDGANSEVLAHFVYSSERMYADSITSLNRPDRVLPPPGRCVVVDPQHNSGGAEPSALLEAGAVTLRAVPLDPSLNSIEVSLAPRAFPGVSSLSPGVVYTSRDRQPLLPTGAAYELEVHGGSDVPAMKLRAEAPSQLTSVTVAGTPLRQVTDLAWGQPVDITWDVAVNAPSAEPDLVYVDVTSKDVGVALLRCAYLDSAGSGTLPWTDALAEGLARNAQASLNLHRHRRVISASSDAVAARGEVRFDFELTRDVNFVTAVPSP